MPSPVDPLAPASSALPAVELRHIVKRFPGVVANRDVNLRVRAGTVHAVVGENGAGKSTLMHVLYGMQRPDDGTVLVDGAEVAFRSPNDAIAAGIGMVHQHFMLADNLTVLENIVVGREPRRFGMVDRPAARRRIAELGDAYGLAVPPDELVAALGVGQRQRVEILKVLFRGARTLILDEPTAVLVPQEADELFANLVELTRRGLTVVFVSHKLDEVLAVADEITVIRAGATVATADPARTSARQLAELMVGGQLPTPATHAAAATDDPVLRVSGLTCRTVCGRPLLDDVTLTLHRGEIVGLAGVEGNGQAELIEALMGQRRIDAGSITLDRRDITGWPTRRRRQAGLGHVPEDRQRQGLLLDAPLWENAMLGHQGEPPNARGPWIDRAGARRRAAEIVRRFDVRTPGLDVTARALSGGNQQKLLIGRELLAEPTAMVAAHPTRGVDVGAQAAIWDQLRVARSGGLATLLVSADLQELIGLSDVLLVIFEGRIVARLDPATVTPRQLGGTMTRGAATDGGGAA